MSPTPRLDAYPLRLLASLARIAISVEQDLKRCFDLSLAEYDVLTIVEHESLPQKSIQAHTKASPSAVSRWLTRLVREGWVSREIQNNNQRKIFLKITRRGRNQLRRIRGHFIDTLQPMPDVITAEDERLLIRVEENMNRLLDRVQHRNTTGIPTKRPLRAVHFSTSPCAVNGCVMRPHKCFLKNATRNRKAIAKATINGGMIQRGSIGIGGIRYTTHTNNKNNGTARLAR